MPDSRKQLSSEPVELVVDGSEASQRLDAFLAGHFTAYSRVHLRRVITAGGVKVDGQGGKPAYRLKPGQRVTIVLPEIPREAPQPEDIPLDILYQDDDLVVVNILAKVIMALAQEGLAERVRPGGQWVTAGIIESQVTEVVAALQAAGLQVTAQRQMSDWVTLTGRRPETV